MQIPPSYPAFNPAPGSSPGDDASKNAINGAVGAQAANAAGAVSATAPIGDPSQQMWTLTLDAMGYLSAIDMAMRNGNMTLAVSYANKLLSECKGNCCPAMNTVISGMMGDFTISSGQVTAINQSQFVWDWSQPQGATQTGNTAAVGGVQQIFANILTSQGGQPNPLGSLAFNGNNAMSSAWFFLFLSDTMLCPTVTMSGSNPAMYKFGTETYDLSDYIWGNSSGGSNAYKGPEWGPMYLQDVLPMLVGSALYQQDVNPPATGGYAQFQSDLSNFIGLFPTKAQLDSVYSGGTEPDFTGYLEATSKLNALLTDYPSTEPSGCIFPPSEWISTMTSAPYNWPPNIVEDYFKGANNNFGTPCDMTDFFNSILTRCFDGFVGGGPF